MARLIPMSLDPQKTAFIFPGQGSQVVGMGRALAEADRAAVEVFKQADIILGYSISELCWEGTTEVLNDTQHTQPALLTHSIAVLRAFQHRYPEFEPAYTAGHSLGEFSALVAAGALTFPDALRLVRERGQAMKASGERQPGGMVAVIGMELPKVEEACRWISSRGEGSVWVANDNCPGQVVISGDQIALASVSKRLVKDGARKVVRLAVSIASHSPIMKFAQEHFNQVLQTTPILNPRIQTIGNVSAEPLISASLVRGDLSAQLTSRVRWTESIQAMIDTGITTYLEMGPGNVLTGLLKRIDRSITGLALNTPASFISLAETL